jgi:hypothetical protein
MTRDAAVAGDLGDARMEIPVTWDPNEYRAMVCRSCKRPRVFRRPRINHSFQFMLALGTLGLWLPAWGVGIILQGLKPWNCTVCHGQQRRSS